jgi:cytochrome c553
VFAYSKQPGWSEKKATAGDEGEPTHLFEIKLDGTGLRQLTSDPKWIDTEPAYLADGGVVFGSDRAGIGSECGAWEQNAGTLNLFRTTADGKSVRRLTVNKDYDRYPHTLNNGLVAFLRWDYAERQFFSCHSLWSVRPDGTMADTIYKSHIQASPYSLRDPRPIPGSDKIIAIACGHHNLAEGAVTLVNPNLGVNNADGMRYVTPRAGPTEGGFGQIAAVPEGGVPDREGLYQTPWALSEKSFLVSYAWRQPGSANAALYYIDVWGHKELLHRDPLLECAYPLPIKPRPRPPVLADTTQPHIPHGVAHVSNVYQDLPGIARGTVKWLRISERVNWLFDKTPHGELRWVPGNPFSPQFGYWTWAPIRVIGLVPVAEDGSAYFQVPAGLGVYFQALDENFMEVRRMRSHIAFQPGETRACIGCHESKGTQTPASSWQKSAAAARPPARPAPPPWGDCAVLDYEKMVQPIFDRSCVSCHGAEKPKAGLDLTAQRDGLGFAQSYRSLFGLKRGAPTPVLDGDGWYRRHFPQAKVCDGKDWFRLALENKAPGQLVCVSDRTTSPWQKPIDANISQPKQFGSHQSRLVLHLLNDAAHRERLKPGSADWLTLVTWLDANAPYRSTFYQKFDEQGRKLAQPLQVPIVLQPPFTAAALAQQRP